MKNMRIVKMIVMKKKSMKMGNFSKYLNKQTLNEDKIVTYDEIKHKDKKLYDISERLILDIKQFTVNTIMARTTNQTIFNEKSFNNEMKEIKQYLIKLNDMALISLNR
jgi:hypothetical protein